MIVDARMIWRLFQAGIIIMVAGTLLARGATKNGLAAGVVGFLAARVATEIVSRVASIRFGSVLRSWLPVARSARRALARSSASPLRRR